MASDDTLARLALFGVVAILVAAMVGAIVGPGVNPEPYVQTPDLESGDTAPVPRANGSSNLTADQVETIERYVVAYANAERAEINHEPLIRNPDLAMVARAHSYDMAKRSYFSHENPDGQHSWDRVRESGIDCDRVAENIARVPWGRTLGPYDQQWVTYDRPRKFAKDVVARLMASGQHRSAILNPNNNVIGVGSYASGTGNIGVTMLFCGHDEWRGTGGRTPVVAHPGADYNMSYWDPYPPTINASWDERDFSER